MRVEIRLGTASISVEGELDEVSSVLAEYWTPVHSKIQNGETNPASPDAPAEASTPPKRPKRTRARRSPTPLSATSEEDVLDAMKIANKIKQRTDFDEIKQKILDVKADWPNKCKLVALVVDGPITSGDVLRVLKELRIRTSLPRLSEALSKNASEYLTAPGPKGSQKYTMTTTTKESFEKWLKATDE